MTPGAAPGLASEASRMSSLPRLTAHVPPGRRRQCRMLLPGGQRGPHMTGPGPPKTTRRTPPPRLRGEGSKPRLTAHRGPHLGDGRGHPPRSPTRGLEAALVRLQTHRASPASEPRLRPRAPSESWSPKRRASPSLFALGAGVWPALRRAAGSQVHAQLPGPGLRPVGAYRISPGRDRLSRCGPSTREALPADGRPDPRLPPLSLLPGDPARASMEAVSEEALLPGQTCRLQIKRPRD